MNSTIIKKDPVTGKVTVCCLLTSDECFEMTKYFPIHNLEWTEMIPHFLIHNALAHYGYWSLLHAPSEMSEMIAVSDFLNINALIQLMRQVVSQTQTLYACVNDWASQNASDIQTNIHNKTQYLEQAVKDYQNHVCEIIQPFIGKHPSLMAYFVQHNNSCRLFLENISAVCAANRFVYSENWTTLRDRLRSLCGVDAALGDFLRQQANQLTSCALETMIEITGAPLDQLFQHSMHPLYSALLTAKTALEKQSASAFARYCNTAALVPKSQILALRDDHGTETKSNEVRWLDISPYAHSVAETDAVLTWIAHRRNRHTDPSHTVPIMGISSHNLWAQMLYGEKGAVGFLALPLVATAFGVSCVICIGVAIAVDLLACTIQFSCMALLIPWVLIAAVLDLILNCPSILSHKFENYIFLCTLFKTMQDLKSNF